MVYSDADDRCRVRAHPDTPPNRRGQGKGRTVRRLPRRERHFETENIPSLAGQPDQFIQWQLVFFRGGSRKNEQMQPIVEQIGNEDIRTLGAYFRRGRRRPPSPTTIPICRRRARRPRWGGAARHAIPIDFAGTKAVARRRPARGISGQGAARLQIGRTGRRRRGGDGGCRIPLSEEEIRRSRIISRISVTCLSPVRLPALEDGSGRPRGHVRRGLCGASSEIARRRHADDHPRCFSYALRWV